MHLFLQSIDGVTQCHLNRFAVDRWNDSFQLKSMGAQTQEFEVFVMLWVMLNFRRIRLLLADQIARTK